MDYTLADIARITEAKRRTCQLWAEAGAILAVPESERGGSGVHRKFARTEVMIACVLADFAVQKAAIGRLIEIGSRIRMMFEYGTQPLEIFENAVLGIGRNYIINKSDFGRNGGPGILTSFVVDEQDKQKSFYEVMERFEKSGEGALVSVLFLNRCLSGMR